MVVRMTKKESELRKCALMILHDQCPPDRKHYLCMTGEDDTALDCTHYEGKYSINSFDETIHILTFQEEVEVL